MGLVQVVIVNLRISRKMVQVDIVTFSHLAQKRKKKSLTGFRRKDLFQEENETDRPICAL